MFTGGSLIVGSAARTDLLGEDRAAELARAQYASLHRLATLPDATAVWPTHGAGSFCSAPPGAARTSTIGAEKAHNPLLAATDANTFVDGLLSSLGSHPAYFRWFSEVNRRGPAVIVRNADQDPADILWPALNIGVERIVGELAGGMPAWTQPGGDVVTTRGSSARTRSTRRSWTSASTPSTPPGTCPMPYT